MIKRPHPINQPEKSKIAPMNEACHGPALTIGDRHHNQISIIRLTFPSIFPYFFSNAGSTTE
ncbi:hypothetical protein D082_30170 [Synechocystis sp. PCC 6714]|nr:hypothetical protein D082_30170 [Synechocystis sp. PCC 6714]